MKLDLAKLDLVEAAAAVAHAAASQLYGMFNETDGYDWPGTGLEGDPLAGVIYEMGAYCQRKSAFGDQLWLKFRHEGVLQDGIPESKLFADVETSRQWSFQIFARIFRSNYDDMLHLRNAMAAQAEAAARKPAPKPDIEDTIFEPIGSMNEMEPHQRQFLAALARPRREVSPEPEPVIEVQPEPLAINLNTINLGAPSEEKPENQQPPAGNETEQEAGGTPQADALVQRDGDTPAAGDGNGQQGEPDGTAGDADQAKEPVKPAVEDAEKAKNSQTGTKRKRN
ncbi:hypothetical protein EDC90_103330 [Martelella mediterranea]|uniref:Uncharacterized protein n=1 Tax=Martelella mediterranea TaxID=293089 RepID=A0A4R3NR25_9HYPH|nr:hypothetical protein EDC90_103330 [Martelella mediterranea]